MKDVSCVVYLCLYEYEFTKTSCLENNKTIKNEQLIENRWNIFDLFELIVLNTALQQTNYIQKDAAELLGINPRIINYKIQKWKRR